MVSAGRTCRALRLNVNNHSSNKNTEKKHSSHGDYQRLHTTCKLVKRCKLIKRG